MTFCIVPIRFRQRWKKWPGLVFPQKSRPISPPAGPSCFMAPTMLRRRIIFAIAARASSAGQGNPLRSGDGLIRLVEDTNLYAQLVMSSQAAFLADFTLNSMKKNVRSFLGYPD